MHLEPALAYLIADGARARLVLRHADGRYSDMAQFGHDPHRHSGHVARAASERVDQYADLDAFAAEIARELTRLTQGGAFGRLVLVAPSRMLHALREALKPPVAGLVVGALAKDLTKLPQLELEKALDETVLGLVEH